IITTASIVAPLLGVLGFVSPLEIALAVTSLCAGAMVVSHVNDSFFWVVTQMSNMSIKTGYRLHTLGTFLCGLGSMVSIWLIYIFVC
ncbi:MAG: GntP family permease, partial [Bacteroidales bacterium]|nr:GntP family permease [Bacteroidales bacterium]